MTEKQTRNLREGAPIPSMQKIAVEIELRNGAPVPKMQKPPTQSSEQNSEISQKKQGGANY